MSGDQATAEGIQALAHGQWQAARDAFEQAVTREPSPAAYEGLGMACWWLDEQQAVLDARETAFRAYREAGDRCSAARVAIALGVDYADYRGELAVATGWMQRAESLLQDVPLAPEHGWLHLYRGVCDLMFYNDLPEARRRTSLVQALLPALANLDIEMMTKALDGLTSIREGRIGDGMRAMDEAMAAAMSGEMSDMAAIGMMYCALVYACVALADYERASQWCMQAFEFSERLGVEVFSAICRNYHATVLMWTGAWEQADSELSAALASLHPKRPYYAMESLARLGELRRRQGRFDEALEIFDRVEPHRTAVFGRAAIAFDRGDAETAVDLLMKVLRRVGEEDIAEHVFVLDLLLRAHLQNGDAAAAELLLPDMEDPARVVGTTPLAATVLAARGAVALHLGDAGSARRCFEDAIDLFAVTQAGFEAARTRLEYARALTALGRQPAAVQQTMLAQQTFSDLGALFYRHQALELVRTLAGDAPAPAAGRALPNGLTAREAEVLWLIAEGKTNQEIADDLVLSVRTVERHISTIYEKLGLHGHAARASAASIAFGLRANT